MVEKHLLTKEQEDLRDHIGLRSGLKGAAIGLGLGVAATVVAFRRSPDFRSLSRPLQSLLAVSGGASGFLFASDRAVTRFENRELGYADEAMLVEMQRRQRYGDRDESASAQNSVLNFLNDNRWGVIGATWAASMVGALGITFSNRYMTTQQKLVQARMYAQAATIAVLMASAGLSVYMGDDKEKKRTAAPDGELRAVLEMPDTPAQHDPRIVHRH